MPNQRAICQQWPKQRLAMHRLASRPEQDASMMPTAISHRGKGHPTTPAACPLFPSWTWDQNQANSASSGAAKCSIQPGAWSKVGQCHAAANGTHWAFAVQALQAWVASGVTPELNYEPSHKPCRPAKQAYQGSFACLSKFPPAQIKVVARFRCLASILFAVLSNTIRLGGQWILALSLETWTPQAWGEALT